MFEWIDQSKLDRSKFERQKEIVTSFFKGTRCGSFLAATGFGKTFVGMMCIDFIKSRRPGARIIVVVPSDFLRTQWKELLEEAKLDQFVLVETVQTLMNRSTKHCDLLILDELHSYTSEKFKLIFQRINYLMVLGMTATLYDKEGRKDIIDRYCPIFDEVPLKECMDKGWVSDYICYNVAMKLTDEQQNYYKILSGKFNGSFGFFGHNLDLVFKVLRDRKEAKKYADEMGFKLSDVLRHAATVSRNMKLRKKFLYELPQMNSYVEKIIKEKCDGRKILTFSQASKMADNLTVRFPGRAVSYHSNLSEFKYEGKTYTGKAMNQKIIELYKEGIFDILNTVKKMDQGSNIEDIDTSFVCIGTSSKLQAIQRTGRQLRKQAGKRAVEFNLYVPDTQSEKWLRDRQRKHPKHAIKYITTLEEIVI